MQRAPIIFCHYGNKTYLRYALACARLSNPDKEVILLGDASNARTARKLGVRHESFADYFIGPRFEEFERVYERIQGPEHKPLRGGRDWLRFVFARWFAVGTFIEHEGVGPFWHFDSDNMLLVPLAPHEQRLSAYACTEQCDGCCMNGYVSGPNVVGGYLDKINEIFRRAGFAEAERARLAAEDPGNAYNEMGAFTRYRDEESIRATRLNALHDGAMFDDCICYPNGLKTEASPPGRDIKTVHLSPDGRFVCEDAETGALVPMNSLNLSWVPTATFRIVLEHLKRRTPGGPVVDPDLDAHDTIARRLAAGEGGRPLRMFVRKLTAPFRRS